MVSTLRRITTTNDFSEASVVEEIMLKNWLMTYASHRTMQLYIQNVLIQHLVQLCFRLEVTGTTSSDPIANVVIWRPQSIDERRELGGTIQ